jgi:hypothetical protein
MLYSFPIAASTLANRTGIPRVLAKIFAQLGLTGL